MFKYYIMMQPLVANEFKFEVRSTRTFTKIYAVITLVKKIESYRIVSEQKTNLCYNLKYIDNYLYQQFFYLTSNRKVVI